MRRLDKSARPQVPFFNESCFAFLHVFHLFVISCPSRQRLINYLDDNNIGNLIHYPIPPYKQECYKDLLIDPSSYPITEHIHEQILSIPMDPTLSNDSLEIIIKAINAFELK